MQKKTEDQAWYKNFLKDLIVQGLIKMRETHIKVFLL